MTIENTLPKQSSESIFQHEVVVNFGRGTRALQLQSTIDYCRASFGHRGCEAGWWWRPKTTFRSGIFIFSFKRGEDALAFKLIKG